eukprot:m.39187 g.39187  ORF g.39187 m.39187 type:complete len:212 (+) comp11246_c1_seq2:173-808(+)
MFNKRRVPRDGQILVSPALRGSNVTAALKQRRASMSVGKVPDLDVDYVCGTGCAAVVLSEATVIAGPGKPSLKAKLTALKGYSRPAVLMMNTPMVAGQYMAFQTWVLTAFRLPVLPVTTADEAAQYLQELARQTVKPVELQRPPTENMDTVTLRMVQGLPGVGEKKARALLKRFTTLQSIAAASEDALAVVLNQASATKVYRHFRTDFGHD